MNNQQPYSNQELILFAISFFGSGISFFILFQILFLIVESKSKKNGWVNESNWDSKKSAEFVNKITSSVHAFVSICFAFVALFKTCKEPGKSEYSNFFVSDYCLMETSYPIQCVSILVTSGYLVSDTFVEMFWIKDGGPLQQQTYIHHFIGVSGFITAVIFGKGGPLIIANAFLFNEISTFFLNYRQFLLTFKWNKSCLYPFNSVLFFFSFLFGRIIFNLAMAYWLYKMIIITYAEQGVFEQKAWKNLIFMYTIFLYISVTLLNGYWFQKILQHLLRTVKPTQPFKHHKQVDEA